MDGLSKKDIQIFREKSRAFCGSVKIPLDKLQHEEIPDNPRQCDEKNITRLVDVFSRDGCYRLEPYNRVPALIPRSALPARDFHTGENLELFDPKWPLVFLHGQHRIEAAKRFLPGNDRWWTVDLFADGELLGLLMVKSDEPRYFRRGQGCTPRA